MLEGWRRLAVAVLSVLLLSSCVRDRNQPARTASLFGKIHKSTGGAHAGVGEIINFGFVLTTDGGETTSLHSATVEGVPEGLTVVRVVAVRPAKKGVVQVGVARGELEKNKPGAYEIRPINAINLSGRPDWAILVTVRATMIGELTTRGLRIVYDLEGRRIDEVLPLKVRLIVSRDAPKPTGTSSRA